ncbi:hypothetical protein J6590_011717 [Homalodisca vitripennis]|nr:hypothetical protein J6590_011717 [Homalodisca vitripennis]
MDVIYMVAKSYDEIPSSTFTKSWGKEETMSLNWTITSQSMLNDLLLLSNSGELIENDILNHYDIVEAVTQEKELEEEAEISIKENGGVILSHEEGMAALECVTTYIDQQAVTSAVDVVFMKKWCD